MIKPKAIFVSAHLPTLNIPVAGQKIAFNNLKELSKEYDVILISFINDIEKKYFDDSIYQMCFKKHFIKINQMERIKSILLNVGEPVRVSPRNKQEVTLLIKEYIKEFDIKLFHAEYTAAMSYVHLFSYDTIKEVVEHDIVYQSFERYCSNKKLPSKLFYCIEAKRQKKWELQQLKLFNKIIVLNDKDKQLLEKEELTNVSVTFPSVEEWCYCVKRDKFEQYSILFLGAMNRFENQDAIIWFVKDILPLLKNKIPDIKLYIVGGNPPENILKLASDNIIVTGFVDSLQEYFEKVHIAVVPLRYGAGVKIKTLETLAANIPTISTEIGAEGIPENKNLYVANTEKDFFEEIMLILGRPQNV